VLPRGEKGFPPLLRHPEPVEGGGVPTGQRIEVRRDLYLFRVLQRSLAEGETRGNKIGSHFDRLSVTVAGSKNSFLATCQDPVGLNNLKTCNLLFFMLLSFSE